MKLSERSYRIGFPFFQPLFRPGITFHLALRRLTVSLSVCVELEGFKLKLKEHTSRSPSRNLTLA